MEQKPPIATISAANRAHRSSLPFEDTRDFENADRGFIGGALEPCVVTAADGRVVWNNDAYGFLAAEAPPTPCTRACGGNRSCAPNRASTR